MGNQKTSGEASIVDLVTRLGGGDTLDVREGALGIIRTLDRQGAIPAILPLLQDTSGEVRVNAAEALLILDRNSAIERVIKLLFDPVDFVRWNACNLLGWHGDERAVDPLCRVLRSDPETDVRAKAAEVLGVLGDSRAISTLTEAISHGESTDSQGFAIRDLAANSLRLIAKRGSA